MQFEERDSQSDDPKKIIEALNNQFQRVFTSQIENRKISRFEEFLNACNFQEKNATINHIEITLEEILSNPETHSDGLTAILLEIFKKAIFQTPEVAFAKYSGKS